jgi:AcrR family transcriptional regulator
MCIIQNVTEADEARRARVLTAALKVFGRHGYQKTSMNEVAQAAGISRPNLYLHFSNKETLYRAALKHELDTALAEASNALEAAELPLGQRVAGCLEAWLGRYVGSSLGVGIESLLEDDSIQLSSLMTEYHHAFDRMLAEAISESITGSAESLLFQYADVSPEELTAALVAIARGLRDYSTSRAEFSAGVNTAVRLAFTAFPAKISRDGD